MKTPEVCDMPHCNSTSNVQQFSKAIFFCDTCWFYIMNGIRELTDEESDYLENLEKERVRNE